MDAFKIRAVVFDLGDTVWFLAHPPPDEHLFALEAERAAPLLDEWGIKLEEPIEDLIREGQDAGEAFLERERALGRFREASIPFLWRGLLGVRGIGISEEQAIALWRAAWIPVREFGVELYPDALDVLAALKGAGLRIGIATNRPCTAEMLVPDLIDFGIGPYVDAIVCSGDVGYTKPHPAAFERVIGLLGVAPQETLMVGDGAGIDVRGGRAAGMRTVWKLNGRHGVDPSPDADFTIHDLNELLALPPLARLLREPAAVVAESPMPHEDGNADRY
jgi:HAD superfamily hydrolase (TIGR01509 family)